MGANANLYCVSRLGPDEAGKVIEMVEKSTGKPCPCKLTGQCPMLLGRQQPTSVVGAA